MFEEGYNRQVRVGLTPLIDMVFLLIVFFMLTTTFHDTEVIPLQLGTTKEVTVQQVKDDTPPLIVTVISAKKVRYKGEEMSVRDVQMQLIKDMKKAKKDQVFVQNTPSAKVGDMVHVLDAIRKAGTGNVVLVETPARGRATK